MKHALAIASAEEKVLSEHGILEETMLYCEDTSVSDARFRTQNWVELQSNEANSQHETQSVVAPVYAPVLQNKENQDTSVLKCIQDGQKQQRRLIEAIYLPKTELPVFDGDPLFYYHFIRAFEYNVEWCMIDETAKLTRLLQ